MCGACARVGKDAALHEHARPHDARGDSQDGDDRPATHPRPREPLETSKTVEVLYPGQTRNLARGELGIAIAISR